MKIYTIGRDASSKITFTDDLISRQHAILRVHNTGKMEIIDKSANGTFINNIRIASNVPVPVRRSDIVSFARARQLDWTMVDNPLTVYRNILFGAVGFVLIILACVLIPRACDESSNDEFEETGTELKKQSVNPSNGGGVAKSDDDQNGNNATENPKDTTKGKSSSWVNEAIRKASSQGSSKKESHSSSKESSKEPKVKDSKKKEKETPEETSGFVL